MRVTILGACMSSVTLSVVVLLTLLAMRMAHWRVLVGVLLVLGIAVLSLVLVVLFPPLILVHSLQTRTGVMFRLPHDRTHGGGHAGQEGRPVIALTIDDAPTAHTPLILDALKQHKVRANFFMIGERAAARPDLVQAVHQQGHLVCNHDMHDRVTASLAPDQLYNDLSRTSQILRSITGRDVRFMRPGSGLFTQTVLACAARLGLTVVLGDVYGHDVMLSSAAVQTRYILFAARPGSIVIQHDGSQRRAQVTADTLHAIIPALQAQGFEFVTLDEVSPS